MNITKNLQSLLLLLCLSLPITGCMQYGLENTAPKVQVTQSIVDGAKQASADIPKEDKETLRKMFLGFPALVEHAEPTTTFYATRQFDKVRVLYGWEKNKYPKWNDFLKNTMAEQDFTEEAQSIKDVGPKLSNVFRSIATGLE